MILSNQTLEKLLSDGTIKIAPRAELKEAAIKIHFSNKFSKTGNTFSTKKEIKLKPKEFILALSKETITLPSNYAGLYDGYTHLARQGVMTHLGSMFVYPGTDGQITLEIFNASQEVVVIKPDTRAGQLVLFEVR